MSPTLPRITVFADFSCPFSYLSEAVLWGVPEISALATFRAYELFPPPDEPEQTEYSAEEWAAIRAFARETGIELKVPGFRPRTRKPHEAAAFAAERGRTIDLRREIYSAYWGEGRDIARIDVLLELARRVGLDPDELRVALDIDRYAEEVVADRTLAEKLGVPGSPTLYLGTGPSARVLVGARPPSELLRLLNESKTDGAAGD